MASFSMSKFTQPGNITIGFACPEALNKHLDNDSEGMLGMTTMGRIRMLSISYIGDDRVYAMLLRL